MFWKAFKTRVNEDGQSIAVINGVIEKNYTQLYQEVLLRAQTLNGYGLNHETIAGLCIADEYQHLICTLALIFLGGKQVTLPSYESPDYRAALAKRLNVNFMLTDIECEDDNFAEKKIQISKEFDKDIKETFKYLRNDSAVVYFLTSGSTGIPKVTGLNQQNLFYQSLNWKYPMKKDVYWRPTSVEYNNAKRQRLYNIINGSVNILERYVPGEVIPVIEKYSITFLSLSVVQARTLLNEVRQKKIKFPKDCCIRLGGASCPVDLRKDLFKEVTEKIHFCYATSEFGGISTLSPRCEDDCGSSDGEVHPNISLEIVDEAGNLNQKNQRGLIRVKSTGMIQSYIGDISATEQSFINGWFYPGDIGRINDNNLLVIEGRADDMMSLAGINIFPAEIEKIFSQHHAIEDCVALKLSSQNFGDIPVLVVSTKFPIGIDELLSFGKKNMGIRAPRKVCIVDKINRTFGGKIDKNELRKYFKND